MGNYAEELEELAAINSELRYITLELMKIAVSKDKPFDWVLKEFTSNAFKTRKALVRGASRR